MLPYAATIFLSAFLLFLVQPIIAKQILPWFGGAASVWAICLVFFQSALLAGYAYADWTTRFLKPRKQAWLHVGVLALSLLVLPIFPDTSWKPTGNEDPTFAILGLLLFTIGLPYFLLSTTSPLVQSWYWQKFKSGVPYRLFALSNFASLLALLSYPIAIEPWISAKAQSWVWSGGYALFALLCGLTALSSAKFAERSGASRRPDEPVTEGLKPAASLYFMWIVLSAMGSCLLLAVTNHLTQNIASVPFLWVVPLSLYLITFILCFDHPRWYYRPLFLPLAAVSVLVMAWQIDEISIYRAAPLYAAGLFVLCMFCHGELTRLKPGPQHLTTFYLMISVGGALGALLIGILAPNLMTGYYELGACLIAVAVLLFVRTRSEVKWIPAAAILLIGGVSVLIYKSYEHYHSDTRVIMRNFYGVVRTKDFDDPVRYRAMLHGGINHGGQLLDPEHRRKPSSYFGINSGYGRMFSALPEGPRTIGILGLGAGAVAAYARPQDHFVFYEIDPQVAAVATTEFTFLKDSGAKIDIVLGDGRLSLEREKRKFDVLAMDAFSGDAIPMHLLTKEAMGIYVDHLKPDGVIIFQATNRFVDLMPAIAKLAEAYGMTAIHVSDWPDATTGADYWTSSTDQVIVTRNPQILQHPRITEAGKPITAPADFRIWTDDFYNMLRVLK